MALEYSDTASSGAMGNEEAAPRTACKAATDDIATRQSVMHKRTMGIK
jgi:hypothetical protein